MIKKGIDLSYKVDPYGTEEIISSAANSCAPILTIDYGDEVQTDAEFTIRPTKGSLDTNISDVASINPIKGNTKAWNQLVNGINTGVYITNIAYSNQVFTLNKATTSGTVWNDFIFGTVPVSSSKKYYILVTKISGTVSGSIKISDGWDASLSISDVERNAKILNNCHDKSGNGLGLLMSSSSTADSFQFKLMLIDLTLIYGAGNEPSTPEAFEADYYKWFGKQLTYEPYSAGELRPVKMNGIKTTGANNSWVSVNPIPVTTLTGKLNGQGSSVVVFPDGMKKAGSVYDEIVKVNGVWKAYKRIGVADLGEMSWSQSSNIFISSGLVGLVKEPIGVGAVANAKCPIYTTVSYGDSSGLDKVLYIIFAASAYHGKIYIIDSSYNDADTFKSEMLGMKMYYELNTPEEYILDAFDVKKMMLGSNEVRKVYLGSDLIFEETN